MTEGDTHLVRARQALRNAAAVVPRADADGLAAGAIALRERGEGAGAAVLLERGTTPWTEGAPLPDGPLAVLDWGVRSLDRPALIVDHHSPEAAPRADQVFVTGYGEVPATTTAALMRRIVPEAPAWLAAVGAVGDLGEEGFELPEADERREAAVRRLTSLVNAARRVTEGPVRPALELLVESEDARDALGDPRAAELEEAKRACKADLDRVIRTEPVAGGSVALVRFSSPSQVHPLVARTWARRLAPRLVVAANDGYLPGRVAFAVRGGDGAVLSVLRAALPDGVPGDVLHGHDRAAGGALAPGDFDRVMAALGLSGRRLHAA